MESPVRVLAIDDNRDDLTILRHTLMKMGVAVLAAESAEEGLRVARADKPDVILCDIGLPGMSGYDFVKACKADLVLQRIPTIALTGQEPAVANESIALQAGFDAFCLKAGDSKPLERVITQLLGNDDIRGAMLHRMMFRREMDDIVLRVGRLEQGQEAQARAVESIQGMQGDLLRSIENIRAETRAFVGEIAAMLGRATHRNETLFACLGMVSMITLACVIYVAWKVGS